LEDFPAEADRLAVLSDDTIVFAMIDSGYLPAHRIAADIDHGEVIGHG
jgi:hypothetical protein